MGITRISAADLPAATNTSIDTAGNSLRELGSKAGAAVESMAQKASSSARDGAAWVRHGGEQLRDGAGRIADRGTGYVREQPIRSVLLAAAAGAAVVAATQALRRERD